MRSSLNKIILLLVSIKSCFKKLKVTCISLPLVILIDLTANNVI